ncbi:MAG: MMPL family transporter [Planctomycetaceae bacterium]|nr:MMPL family transporter [Planctomycetaceae bacterium]
MFRGLAQFLTRHWALVLGVWAAGAVAVIWAAPSKSQDAITGESSLLPAWMPSRRADELIATRFQRSADLASAVIVVERTSGLSGMPAQGRSQPQTESDWAFLSRLTATLRQHAAAGAPWNVTSPADPQQKFVESVLVSHDRQAAVIVVGLPFNFLSKGSGDAVRLIESMAAAAQPPPGLDVAITGSAGYGRDYAAAITTSLHRTTWVAAAVVVVILLILYRAVPVVLMVMGIVALAVAVALSIILIVARFGWSVSTMVELFSIIIGFGGGVDFSLFFLSRYHEELVLAGASIDRSQRQEVIARVLSGTGPAILASAATVVAGLGLMYLAAFPLFHDSGPAVGLSIAVACLASLTLTPVAAYLLGPAIFWPRHIEHDSAQALAAAGLWKRIAAFAVRRHVTILLVTVAVLAPLAVSGWRKEVVYDALADLPASDRSVEGWHMFRRHFSVGEMAPVQIVVQVDKPLAEPQWAAVAMAVDKKLAALPQVRQVRSVAHPVALQGPEISPQLASTLLAQAPPAPGAASTAPAGPGLFSQLSQAAVQQLRELAQLYRRDVLPRYLSRGRESALWQAALPWQPYDTQSMDALSAMAAAVQEAVNADSAAATANPRVLLAGDTAMMCDLRAITDRDFLLVGLLTVSAIIVIVTLLIHDVLVALFVMLATVLTYGTALALTAWTFHLLANSQGLDWKINFFLFVVLVAVGQDYNLFMLTRIMEERRGRDLRPAVQHAIARTGSIVSFCGLVMAATLGSLATSPLRLLQELGMAFIVGILTDTFLVRPLMVPAFILAFNRMKNHAKSKPYRESGDQISR